MEKYIDLPRENDVPGDVVYNNYKGAGVALLYFDGQDYTNLEYVPLRLDDSMIRGIDVSSVPIIESRGWRKRR